MVSSQISPAHSRCQLFDAADWSSPLNRKYRTCNSIPAENPPAHYELLMIQAVQSWDPCWLVWKKNEREKPATQRWIPAGRLNTPNSTTDSRYPRNHPLSFFSPARQDGAQAAQLKSEGRNLSRRRPRRPLEAVEFCPEDAQPLRRPLRPMGEYPITPPSPECPA